MLKNIISRVNVICGNRAALKCLFAVLLITTGVGTASAYDFKTGGLCYNILSKQDKTVEVTYYYHNGNTYNGYEMSKLDAEELLGYVGDEVIPEKVNFDGNEYTVVAIGEYAFRNCSVTSMELPTTVTKIGRGAFTDYSSSLTSVDMPSVTEIGENAFAGCYGLASVDMPLVTSIEFAAFQVCLSLVSVEMPSATSIGNYAFYNCTSLASVEMPSATSIGEFAFYECTSLTSVEMSSATLIGGGAFYNCTSLASVEMPSVTSIGGSAFSGCRDLASVNMPSVTSIGGSAFEGCSALYSVDIPSSVSSIGYRAFYCNNLVYVYCHWQEPLWLEDNPFAISYYATLYIPTGTKSAYLSVYPWMNFRNIVEMYYSSIDETEAITPTVTVIDGAIVIDGGDGTASVPVVEVYSAGGVCVYRGTDSSIGGMTHGVYVVRVGGMVQKVAL